MILLFIQVFSVLAFQEVLKIICIKPQCHIRPLNLNSCQWSSVLLEFPPNWLAISKTPKRESPLMHFLAQKTEQGGLLALSLHLVLAHARHRDDVCDSSQRCSPLQSLYIYPWTKKNLAHEGIWSTGGSFHGYTLPLTHWLCRMGKSQLFHKPNTPPLLLTHHSTTSYAPPAPARALPHSLNHLMGFNSTPSWPENTGIPVKYCLGY